MPKSIILFVCVASTQSFVLLESSSTHADVPLALPSRAEAKERLAAGNRRYRLREFEKAIEEYKAGVLNEDTPVFLHNLGQCYRQLGLYEDAIWYYERFLDRARPSGEIKAAIDGFIKQMKDELARKATERPVALAPDTRPGRSPVPRIVTVIERGEPWYADGLGWGLTGVGALGVGVSVGLIIHAKGLDDDANEEPRLELRRSLHERATERRLTGTIIGIAAGAALVTGIVKLAMSSKERDRRVTTFPTVGVTSGGLVITRQF